MIMQVCRAQYPRLPRTVPPVLRLIVKVALSQDAAGRPTCDKLVGMGSVGGSLLAY